jgi:hypothetical protein
METKCNDKDYKYFLFPPMKEGHGEKIGLRPDVEVLIEQAHLAGKEILQLKKNKMSNIL